MKFFEIEFPADEKLREALQRRVNFDCEKLSLGKFIDHIWKDWHLGNVIVPMTVNLQAPITMHVKEATLESVLKQAFQQVDVRCEFQDGMFLLSPASPFLLVSYPIADLLLAYPPTDVLLGADQPSDAGGREKYDFDSLEKLIRTVIDPASWEGAGGAGKIEHDSKSLCLAIRQTQPAQKQIRNLLQELRKPQQFRFFLQPSVFRHGSDLVERVLRTSGIAEPQAATLLATEESDRLLKAVGYASLPITAVSADVGKETMMRPFPGEHVWPEKIQAISGQIGGRAYIWFELTGNDPATGEPHREGVMSLSPDFKAVLIPLRLAPSQKQKEWPLGPQHTVDEWAKTPERKFLLIRPVVEYTETAKDKAPSR